MARPIARISLILVVATVRWQAAAQDTIHLWDSPAPGATGSGEADVPTLTISLPDAAKATGVGIVVCPGGGYGGLAKDHEGKQIAEWLNGEGIAAFILTYRHAPGYGDPHPLMDAKRAIQTLRSRAPEWSVDPGRIGIIGFSAGGHLSATASTQFDAGDAKSDDPIERVSSRPDFSILLYPVITLTDPYAHAGSRKNLLGEAASEADIARMSAEKNVTADTPPAFIVHTTEDAVVPVQNALLYYDACVRAGVSAELHVFEKGRHGLGLAQTTPGMSNWPALALVWLRERQVLK